MNRQVIEEKTQRANTHKAVFHLAIREIRIKSIMREHFTGSRLAKMNIPRTTDIENQKQGLSASAGSVKWCSCFEKELRQS